MNNIVSLWSNSKSNTFTAMAAHELIFLQVHDKLLNVASPKLEIFRTSYSIKNILVLTLWSVWPLQIINFFNSEKSSPLQL